MRILGTHAIMLWSLYKAKPAGKFLLQWAAITGKASNLTWAKARKLSTTLK